MYNVTPMLLAINFFGLALFAKKTLSLHTSPFHNVPKYLPTSYSPTEKLENNMSAFCQN